MEDITSGVEKSGHYLFFHFNIILPIHTYTHTHTHTHIVISSYSSDMSNFVSFLLTASYGPNNVG